jgi:RNA polymerase sigma-70 factor (ECF subfamily)
MRLPDDVVAEVTQIVRGKLFVGEPPPVLRYLGKGDLSSFVRVVATRAALSRLRKQERDPVELDDAPLERAASDGSPQLRHLKKKYEAEFKAAFSDAVAGLLPQERTLLRHSLVDKLSIDAIGKLYDIHRATAARRVAKARDHVAETTRTIMEERLRLAAGDFSSIVQLVHSQLDLSVTRLLSVDDDDGEGSRPGDRDS